MWITETLLYKIFKNREHQKAQISCGKYDEFVCASELITKNFSLSDQWPQNALPELFCNLE